MRVLAINDISCVGKCSLCVSLPIISACGVTCDVLPTALLSTHTGGFEGYFFHDLTKDIPNVLAHWKTLGIKFDYIYSGYLGSGEQIDLVAQIKKEFLAKDGKFIVDPVMGDNGELYAGFTPEFVEKMRGLCREADFILPNETEAAYLASLPYPLTNTQIALEKLGKLCPRPLVTGISEENKVVVHYLDESANDKRVETQKVEGFFPGSGDVFASAFVGALAKGIQENRAITIAANFTTAAILRSAKEVKDKRYGLNFEAELYNLLKSING